MTNLEDLRIRLDQASERIVSRLKDRSRLPLNWPVYSPDAVPISGRTGISFLQFAIEGLEAYHASLGRYEYRDQHPILSRVLPRSPILRAGTGTDLSDIDMSDIETRISSEMLSFYCGIVPELCREGDDPKTYGETVYVDADLLELMHERIDTIGRYVAHSKFESTPEILQHSDDDQALVLALRNIKREDIVVDKAKETAARYNLDPKVTERVFRWLIKETTDVEVAYLKSLARSNGAAKLKVASRG
jgi:chorismate mutase